MRKGRGASATLAMMVCLSASPAHAKQSFQPPIAEDKNKPRPAQQDSGFKAPEPAAPAPAKRPQQKDTNFIAPETVKAERTNNAAASSSGTNPLMGSARSRFAKARELVDLRASGSAPFKMHAVFSAMTDPELASGGTYSEVWMSPKRWRREAKVGQLQIIESRDGEKFYRKIVGREYAPRTLDDLLEALLVDLPQLDETFVESDWEQGTVLYDGASAFRIASGFTSTPPQRDARAYWLAPDDKPIATYQQGSTVEFSDYDPWSGKQVAHHLTVKQDGVKLAGIWIDQLDVPQPDGGIEFALAGVTAIPLSGAEYEGPHFVPPHPVHQVSPKSPQAGEGTIVVQVHLDRNGHVRSAVIKQGLNPSLDSAAEKAAMEWEFAPALVNGLPTATDATVQFTF